ncbi:MAG TPA: glycosyltransferase family 2 protein [Casimicrobiaceae bacterium]
MRLFGVAMVRDEADVIEAFVRHNLGVLDGLAIADHGSLDGTSEILAALHAEGLALRRVEVAEPGFFQSRYVSELARETLARQNADFVFALDADEFLKIGSRATLERALAAVPAGMHVLAHWLTYVPDDFEASGGAFGPGHLWRRLKTERHSVHKVVVSRALLDQPRAFITDGNHLVAEPGEAKPRRHARLPAEVLAYAHCPVRSRDQLAGKVITGYLAELAAQAPGREFAHHWGELYAELRAGATLTPERLREIACNYTLPRAKWRPVEEIELVEDPMPLTVPLRYPAAAAPDTLRRLMRFAEALIAAERAQAASATRYVVL